jgi:uncharacterized protein YdeI (YjbR/CyaY-like superfamily)
LIHGFKDYCALLFMKGVLLKDLKGILIQQTENVQAARNGSSPEIHSISDARRQYSPGRIIGIA